MIPYHGLPITPITAATVAINAGHAFVSHRYSDQLALAVEVCQSFAVDNGAFSAWKSGNPVKDWGSFYEWATMCLKLPNCDFVVAPDKIDGSELENDFLLWDCPLDKSKIAPVWHMHESMGRLEHLVDSYPRICIGSSGDYATVGNDKWWHRMAQAMEVACDSDGYPKCKIHGLRMLNPSIFSRLPLSSADSTNIGRNVGIDKHWSKGNYLPVSKDGRAHVMRHRIEGKQSAKRWDKGVISC